MKGYDFIPAFMVSISPAHIHSIKPFTRTYTYKYAAKLTQLVPEFQSDSQSHNFPDEAIVEQTRF